MKDQFDLDERFAVIATIRPPDNWPRITGSSHRHSAERPRRQWLLPAAVAACLAVFAAGFIAAVTVREPGIDPAAERIVASSCVANGTCAPVQWDAISVETSVIDFVYYVDTDCSGPLVGTDLNETASSIDIEVLVAVAPDTECGGEVLQRSGSVLTQSPVGERSITGCRATASRVSSPTNAGNGPDGPDCTIEIQRQFPQYDSSRLRTEFAEMAANPPEGVDFQAPIETEPLDISEPGTYELRAPITPERLADCNGLTQDSFLNDFITYGIVNTYNPDTETDYETVTENGQLYAVVVLEVTDVTYPANGVTVWIC